MKQKLINNLFAICFTWNIFYIFILSYSVVDEYILDHFFYWGYPQWGRLYSSPRFFLWFNICFISLLMGAMFWSWKNYRLNFSRSMMVALSITIISIANMHVSEYNRYHQFNIFVSEKGGDTSRIPSGIWIVSKQTLQKYDDQGLMQKIKGLWGRGDWPGGTDIWGKYRIWLIPQLDTDTKNRRGLVIHGGNKQSSPWGIDMGPEIEDFALRLQKSDSPLELNIDYNNQ